MATTEEVRVITADMKARQDRWERQKEAEIGVLQDYIANLEQHHARLRKAAEKLLELCPFSQWDGPTVYEVSVQKLQAALADEE